MQELEMQYYLLQQEIKRDRQNLDLQCSGTLGAKEQYSLAQIRELQQRVNNKQNKLETLGDKIEYIINEEENAKEEQLNEYYRRKIKRDKYILMFLRTLQVIYIITGVYFIIKGK